MLAPNARVTRKLSRLLLILAAFAALCLPAAAEEYPALAGVKGLDAVFDVGVGNPAAAVVVFGAVRDVHLNPAVRALPAPPRTVMVFRSKAVRLLSTDRSGLDQDEAAAYDKVAALLRQLHKDGIRLEVCMYAVKSAGIDPATLLPEVNRVGNGFVSILGYQAQGYSVVGIP